MATIYQILLIFNLLILFGNGSEREKRGLFSRPRPTIPPIKNCRDNAWCKKQFKSQDYCFDNYFRTEGCPYSCFQCELCGDNYKFCNTIKLWCTGGFLPILGDAFANSMLPHCRKTCGLCSPTPTGWKPPTPMTTTSRPPSPPPGWRPPKTTTRRPPTTTTTTWRPPTTTTTTRRPPTTTTTTRRPPPPPPPPGWRPPKTTTTTRRPPPPPPGWRPPATTTKPKRPTTTPINRMEFHCLDKYFKVVHKEKSKEGAKKYCQSNSQHLINVESLEELNCLRGILLEESDNRTITHIWRTGGTVEEKSKKWKWDDPQIPFRKQLFSPESNALEPNGNCIVLKYLDKYKRIEVVAYDCDTPRHSICQNYT